MKRMFFLMQRRKNIKRMLFGVIVCAVLSVQAREEDSVEHVEQGNLALPTSQQPEPLFGFGQNIVDQGDIQALGFASYLNGKNERFFEVAPAVLYGISDTFSLLFAVPVAAQLKQDGYCSAGVSDLLLQGEYAFYNKDRQTYANQATFVASILLPTGSHKKVPPTGFGSPTFFLGATASHMSVDWYVFSALGTLLTTAHNHGTVFGKQFLYEAGFGRNIAYREKRWLLNWLLEFNGQFSARDKIQGIVDKNSGGNTFSIGPSLFFSTQRLLLLGGVAFPVAQHLFGVQNKARYQVAFYASWKFS
ncbi:MAG: hypothetical protein U1E02_10355 [Hydrogenophaga sp.]|nr:hypothetical protein [Hydrogenophaga sp.]